MTLPTFVTVGIPAVGVGALGYFATALGCHVPDKGQLGMLAVSAIVAGYSGYMHKQQQPDPQKPPVAS